MSTEKRSTGDTIAAAYMVVAGLCVLVFAGWFASTSSAGIFGGVVLFIIGLIVGGVVALLIFGGIDYVAKGEWKAPTAPARNVGGAPESKGIPQRSLGTCPHCGKHAFLRSIPGSCQGCGSNLWDEQLDGSTPRPDVLKFQQPATTYDWVKSERRWRLLFTAEQVNQAKRSEVLAARKAAEAEQKRLTRKPPKPAARLIRKASEAEEVCADWIRWMGFPGAVVTAAGADGGIDVLGPGSKGVIAAQVKFEAVSAGRPKLQELYGAGVAAGATTTAFFSSAGFTAQAKTWANQVGMALFEFTLDGSIEPANEHGSHLFRG